MTVRNADACNRLGQAARSVVEMGGERWEVVTLEKTPGQNGTIKLRCLTP